jgi:2-polyprenyl-6-methoxyphenol hydroxylase-like FAD-dependent oxidoreductase
MIVMDEYDVAIVGASVAGCAAATFLGRQGARVALVESHSDPMTFKRMCTHLIQPSAVSTIERLGLLGSMVEAGGQPSETYTWTRYGWFTFSRKDAQAPASEYCGWNIRRETLDPMIRELAAGTDGVETMLGHTVVGLLRDGKRVSGIVARERDGRERELRAKVVVGADGRGSPIAKLAGVSAKVKKNDRFIYFAYYRDTPLVTGSNPQMWMLDPDVAYAFPTDAGLTLMACMPHKERLSAFKEDPERELLRMFDGLADGPVLDPGKRESKVLGVLDVPNVSRRAASPGLGLIGDAALASDPLPGVGCGWGMQSAEWLADEVGPVLADGRAAIDGALKAYARRHRKNLSRHAFLISRTSAGRKFDPFSKLLFRGAARDQELANSVMLVAGRWDLPRSLLTPSALGHILRVNLSRSTETLGLVAPQPFTQVANQANVSTELQAR